MRYIDTVHISFFCTVLRESSLLYFGKWYDACCLETNRAKGAFESFYTPTGPGHLGVVPVFVPECIHCPLVCHRKDRRWQRWFPPPCTLAPRYLQLIIPVDPSTEMM